ncbi:hypothetical protein BDC45DRAFT_500795 [Circinella umbellata]|nr:hypothetical protein BDC45DRAFT_500795 [Circinella umbellata]
MNKKKPTIRGIKQNLYNFTTTILHFGRRRTKKTSQQERSLSRHEKNDTTRSPSPPVNNTSSISISLPPNSKPQSLPQLPQPQSRSKRLTARVLGLHNKIWRRKKENDSCKKQQRELSQGEEYEDEEDEESQPAVCGCGRPLEAGWECSYCRFTCPTCHRALGEGEQCSRCQPSNSPLPASTITG